MKYNKEYNRYMCETIHYYQETLKRIDNLEQIKRMSELTYEDWCVMHKKEDEIYFRKIKLNKIIDKLK
jgi:hypothetical protein